MNRGVIIKNKLSKVLAMALITISVAGVVTTPVSATKLQTRQEILYQNRNKPKNRFQKLWHKTFEPLNRVLDKIDKW